MMFCHPFSALGVVGIPVGLLPVLFEYLKEENIFWICVHLKGYSLPKPLFVSITVSVIVV